MEAARSRLDIQHPFNPVHAAQPFFYELANKCLTAIRPTIRELH